MNPWDIETAFYTNKKGIEPEKARTFTILRWLWLGDLRPLAAAIWDGQELDQAVLNTLAQMIDQGRLTVRARKRGRPKRPEQLPRDIIAALAYEAQEGNSDEAFKAIAEAIGKSEQTVRQAGTAWRKTNVVAVKVCD